MTTDTKTSEIFLAPRGSVEKPHLIKVSHMGQAQEFLKKLNSGLIQKPFEKNNYFKILEIREDSILSGKVIIFEFEHS